jgi:hypothetical protein
MNMNAFIAEHYNVEFVGEHVERGNLSSAKEVILTCKKQLTGLEEINALFINTFKQQNNTVLVTNVAAHHKIQPSEYYATLW